MRGAPADAAPAEAFQRALLLLDRTTAESILRRGGGITPEVLESTVLPALTAIGRAWEAGDLALSQVYMSGRLCQQIIEAGAPDRVAARPGQSVIAIAVLEDGHVLGKQLVLQILRSGGYDVIDLGAGRTVADLVAEVAARKVDILLISVLMVRSALMVSDLRAALPETKIVVGGAPFRIDPDLGNEVGADFVGRSASDALVAVRALAAST